MPVEQAGQVRIAPGQLAGTDRDTPLGEGPRRASRWLAPAATWGTARFGFGCQMLPPGPAPAQIETGQAS